MNDKERTIEYLKSIGIPFKEWNNGCNSGVRVKEGYKDENGKDCVSGYYDFYCQWNFCQDGKLIEFGIWD